MSYSISGLLDTFRANRYHDVINSIDQESFSPTDQPVIANIVAAAYFKLGEFPSALSLLSEIESCFVDDIDYLVLYGSCLRRCGNLDRADIQFKRALKLNPSSPSLRNNYANLLIDLRRLDEAENILSDLLAINPSYDDAILNLQRLRERRQSFVLESDQPVSAKGWAMGNPLLLAFSQDEVLQSAPLLNQASKNKAPQSKLSDSLPSVQDHQLAADQLKLAQQAVLDGRYDFALQLCSQVKGSLPDLAVVYECASDAYIAKKLFNQAEVCILHSLQFGAKSAKLFINLISLACMRSDFGLAQHYFELLLPIDSEHSALPQLRKQIQHGLQSQAQDLFRFDAAWESPDVSRKPDS